MHNDTFEVQAKPLGPSAYVVVDQADCFYRPDHDSAVCVTPPYGTVVPVMRAQGAWILISFCGKQAWAPREYLSASLTPVRVMKGAGIAPVLDVGGVPLVRYTFNSAATPDLAATSRVEYGPRGGRFVRTESGFRRYF